MAKKSTTLRLSLPQCRFCGRYWKPQVGVNASQAYCARCRKERKTQAASALSFSVLKLEGEALDRYLLPRRLRKA